MEAHSANILRKSGRGASREGFSFRAAAHPERGGICSGRCGAGGRMGAGAACADGLPMVWGAASFPRPGCGGVSGAGVSGAGRGSGGAGSSGSRTGVGLVRAGRIPVRSACSGVDPLFRRGRHRAAAVSGRCRSHPRAELLFRRGPSVPAGPASSRCRFRTVPVASPCGAPVPAWTLCSGGAGIGPVRTVGRGEGRRGPSVPAGRASSRCRFRTGPSHPPDARPPIFARSALRKGPDAPFRTLFVLFCSVPPRRNRRRLQIRGFAAREKRKSCFFIFTL